MQIALQKKKQNQKQTRKAAFHYTLLEKYRGDDVVFSDELMSPAKESETEKP